MRICYAARMDHSPGFLKVVNEARPQVREVTIEQTQTRLRENREAILVDVREDSEWAAGHAAEATHLGRGVLERDIERVFPEASSRRKWPNEWDTATSHPCKAVTKEWSRPSGR
jgi:hypothetical protein